MTAAAWRWQALCGSSNEAYTGLLHCMRSMAASRLSDSQKSELVQRFCDGASGAELAAQYGCSPNTVIRTVKAALGVDHYEQLKQQRARGASQSPAPAAAPLPEPVAQVVDEPDDGEASDDDAVNGVLAIDDADDFADDDGDDDLDDGDDFTPIAVLPLVVSQEPVQIMPLATAQLPESLYMLVDKTVELQAKPLREFTELGLIPPEEEDHQALQLFANPRQAKRQCGRTQRVIKMPDPQVLLRRASYLHGKGISRLVVEGTLYALPGSQS